MAWQGGNDRKNILVNNASCMSSLDAVDMAQKLGCKLFVSTGSQAEYGYQNQVLNEETICKPNTPFGAAKLCSFHYTKLRCKELGIQHLWLRIGSVYGPFDRESTMLLSSIRTIRSGKLPVFSEGTQYWDFLFKKRDYRKRNSSFIRSTRARRYYDTARIQSFYFGKRYLIVSQNLDLLTEFT